MDKIDKKLATYANDTSKPVAIRVATVLAKKTMNRYYSSTDHSDVYRIAMSECNALYYSNYINDTG
jgi:hypothetical protein